jgi:hypothetical protein
MQFASSRLKFTIIEPHPSLLLKCPWLCPIQLTPTITSSNFDKQNCCCYIFTGYREEQISPDCSECLDVALSFLLFHRIRYIVVGKYGSFLSEKDYKEIFTGSSIILILYRSQFYQDRHTGIALESIVNNVPLFMRRSALVDHYIERGFMVSAFSGPSDLSRTLSHLLIDQTP